MLLFKLYHTHETTSAMLEIFFSGTTISCLNIMDSTKGVQQYYGEFTSYTKYNNYCCGGRLWSPFPRYRGQRHGYIYYFLLLTIPHRFSLGFRSGEYADQSSTPTPWSFNQLLVLLAVWAGAKSCWEMKSASLKSWSAEGSMKCSKISW